MAHYLPSVPVSTQRLSLPLKNAALYPNPADMESTLEYQLDQSKTLNIQLLDIHGRLIRAFARQEARDIGYHREALQSPAHLLPGVYTLTIRSRQGVLGMRMVVP